MLEKLEDVNVLLVENEELMAQPLRQAGHHVTVVSSSKAARRLLASVAFDVVLLGGIRPDAARLSACGELRRGSAATPILLLVGRDAAETRVEGLDAGADDCVSLSCPLDELLARLRALVRRSAAEQAAEGRAARSAAGGVIARSS